MVRGRSLAAFGLLFCASRVSAIRSTVSGDVVTGTLLLNKEAPSDDSLRRGLLVAGNCGVLTVRDGLDVGESVKVSSNGWKNEGADFIVTLVSDGSAGLREIKKQEGEAAEAVKASSAPVEEPEGEEKAGHSSPDRVPSEEPIEPYVGVRLPSPVKNGPGDTAQGPAVIVYNKGNAFPKEFPIDTPAGPQTPFMIIFTLINPMEVQVDILTWIEQGATKESVNGKWHMATTVVGAGSFKKDMQVSLNDCQPKTYKVYGPASAELVTAKAGSCAQPVSPLVRIRPSPSQENSEKESGGSDAHVPEPGNHESEGSDAHAPERGHNGHSGGPEPGNVVGYPTHE